MIIEKTRKCRLCGESMIKRVVEKVWLNKDLKVISTQDLHDSEFDDLNVNNKYWLCNSCNIGEAK